MRGKKNNRLRDECINLRVNQRLSYDEICRLTGAPRGSLCYWLRSIPLTPDERADRRRKGRSTKKPRGEESTFSKIVKAFGRELSRAQKNKIAEAAILFRLALHGFEVFGSVFDGDKTDWLVRIPGSPTTKRIEVKWASQSSKYGLPVISLVCSSGHHKRRRYLDGEFDLIVGYDLFTDTAFVYTPSDISNNRTVITTSQEYAERWDKLQELCGIDVAGASQSATLSASVRT